MAELELIEMDRSEDVASLADAAENASEFLKALSHEGRLLILCHLVEGERSVTELEHLLERRQSAVSQQLSRLRAEGMVQTRREGKSVYYRLADRRVEPLVSLLHEMFCKPELARRRSAR